MPFPWLAVGQAAANIGSQLWQNHTNRKQAERERDWNRENAEWAYQKNMELLKFQLDYNTPVNQMKRFKEAGLNPNLVYGQGSPGNMVSAPNVAAPTPTRRPEMGIPMLGTEFAQARLMASQADLINTKNEESQVKQDLVKVQTAVAKANPYLAPGYVDSLVSQLKSTAALKKQEADFKLEQVTGYLNGKPAELANAPARGYVMMMAQWQNLQEKYKLTSADQKIKAEILQSKQFQNDIAEIQAKWMTEGQITSQHVYQFIMLLLSSMLRK